MGKTALMGKTAFKNAIAGTIALLIAGIAAPAGSQSLTDRFKSLFGGGTSQEQPAQNTPPAASQEPQTDDNCPPVTVRSGTASYAVGAPGKQAVGNDVRFLASISKTARECVRSNGEITAHIGIQGRVIVGPAGAPPNVEIPMRIAVVQGGVGEKVIVTKAYRTNVELGEQESVPFTLVVDDLVYPAPLPAVADNYIFYIGFDPQALTPEPKPKVARKRK
jgi:hypothetical protein